MHHENRKKSTRHNLGDSIGLKASGPLKAALYYYLLQLQILLLQFCERNGTEPIKMRLGVNGGLFAKHHMRSSHMVATKKV